MNFLKKPPPKKVEQNSRLIGLAIGDTVRVCADENKVKKLQNEHGGYSTQLMKGVLGKNVKVKHISDSGIKVSWENRDFDLHPGVVEILGEQPTPINIDHLFKAIEEDDLERLCAGILPNLLHTTNSEGRTLINYACVTGHLLIVEMLLGFGSDLNISDNDGNFPIHNCAWLNYFDILKFLLEKHEDQINKITLKGLSLLHIAVIRNNEPIVQYLINKNIDSNIRDQTGRTAYQCRSNTTDLNITRIIEDSNPFSLMELSISSLKICSTRSNVGGTPFDRRKHDQAATFRAIFDNTNVPRDEELTTHRSVSDESDRHQFERNSDLRSVTTQMRTNDNYNYITIAPVSGYLLQPSIETPVIVSPMRPNIKLNGYNKCSHNDKKVVFLECSHTCCRICAESMTICHICQTKIINKMVIYL